MKEIETNKFTRIFQLKKKFYICCWCDIPEKIISAVYDKAGDLLIGMKILRQSVDGIVTIENKKISERPIGIKYRINTCGTCGYMVKKVPLENETIKQNLMTNKQQVKKGEHNE